MHKLISSDNLLFLTDSLVNIVYTLVTVVSIVLLLEVLDITLAIGGWDLQTTISNMFPF